jgi:hypothetical protein
VLTVGVATLVLFVVGGFAGWWDFLKIFLVVAGPALGILIARQIGWRGGVSTIVAGAIGGFLALGCLGFFAVLFPGPPEPGFVTWGDRHFMAAIYILLTGGLLGGFFGAIVGLLAAAIGWLSGRPKSMRS